MQRRGCRCALSGHAPWRAGVGGPKVAKGAERALVGVATRLHARLHGRAVRHEGRGAVHGGGHNRGAAPGLRGSGAARQRARLGLVQGIEAGEGALGARGAQLLGEQRRVARVREVLPDELPQAASGRVSASGVHFSTRTGNKIRTLELRRASEAVSPEASTRRFSCGRWATAKCRPRRDAKMPASLAGWPPCGPGNSRAAVFGRWASNSAPDRPERRRTRTSIVPSSRRPDAEALTGTSGHDIRRPEAPQDSGVARFRGRSSWGGKHCEAGFNTAGTSSRRPPVRCCGDDAAGRAGS